MSGLREKADPAVEDIGKVDRAALEEKNVHHSELLVNADLMSHAFDAENAEHEMSAWQAVKAHPMACFWAFLMCFTIVRQTILTWVLAQMQD
jgi:SP family general alpha glucoside:H+ symporter-like MFS transporter